MQKCSYCRKAASLYAQHFDKMFCKQHLERYLLRKLKRNLNHHHLIRPGDQLEFLGGDSPTAAAELHLLKNVTKEWPVEWKEGAKKKVSGATLEREVSKITTGLFKKKIEKSAFTEKNTIKPFRDFITKELFTLGHLIGSQKDGKSDWPNPLGLSEAGSRLNLLKIFDQIQEAGGHQRGTENR